jgi:transcriptional regulator with XRE-family HTH domain
MFAERAGYQNTDYVSRIERGMENLSISSIAKLAMRLGVDASELFAPTDAARAKLRVRESSGTTVKKRRR